MAGSYQFQISSRATVGALAGLWAIEEFILTVVHNLQPPYFEKDLEEQDMWVGDYWEF